MFNLQNYLLYYWRRLHLCFFLCLYFLLDTFWVHPFFSFILCYTHFVYFASVVIYLWLHTSDLAISICLLVILEALLSFTSFSHFLSLSLPLFYVGLSGMWSFFFSVYSLHIKIILAIEIKKNNSNKQTNGNTNFDLYFFYLTNPPRVAVAPCVGHGL